MPKVIAWDKERTKKLKTIEDLNSFLETIPPYAITNNNKVNCNI
jgi:hypothetical protein